MVLHVFGRIWLSLLLLMFEISILVLYGNLLAQRGMHVGFGSALDIQVANFVLAPFKSRCLRPGLDRGNSESLRLPGKFLGQRSKNGESGVHITSMFVQFVIVWSSCKLLVQCGRNGELRPPKTGVFDNSSIAWSPCKPLAHWGMNGDSGDPNTCVFANFVTAWFNSWSQRPG